MKGWYKINLQFNLTIINKYTQQTSKPVPFPILTFKNARSPFHKFSNLISSGVKLKNSMTSKYLYQVALMDNNLDFVCYQDWRLLFKIYKLQVGNFLFA